MNGRDERRETLGAYALGVLPVGEATALSVAVRDDAELRAEFFELREAADAVALSAIATLDDLDELAAARMRRKILGAVRHPDEVDLTLPQTVAARAAHPWLAYGVAAAAVVFAAGSFAAVSSLQLQIAADRSAIERAHAETLSAVDRDRDQVVAARDERRNVEAILSEHARHFKIRHGEVISTQGRLYLALTRLGTLPAGKVYQTWTIAPGRPPIPGATFVPLGDVTVVALGAPSPGVVAVALTVEPKGGSKKPTSPPSFVRRLD